MRKLFICLVACVSLFATKGQVHAQKELGIFNSLAIGVSASTTGIGVDLATPITSLFAVRAGVSFMPGITFNTDVDVNIQGVSDYTGASTLELEGGLKRTQGELLFSVYPFPASSFYATVGAYFGGSKVVSIKGHSDDLEKFAQLGNDISVVIGDYTLPVDQNGDVSGGLEVNAFRPYVGVGFGRAVPKSRVGVMVELGVQIHGKPNVYTDYGSIDDLLTTLDPDDAFTKIMDKVVVYPVLKIRLCGRLF